MKTQQGVPSQPSRLEAVEVGSTTIKLRYCAIPIGRQLVTTAFPRLPNGLYWPAIIVSVSLFVFPAPLLSVLAIQLRYCTAIPIGRQLVTTAFPSLPIGLLAGHKSVRQFVSFPCAASQCCESASL